MRFPHFPMGSLTAPLAKTWNNRGEYRRDFDVAAGGKSFTHQLQERTLQAPAPILSICVQK